MTYDALPYRRYTSRSEIDKAIATIAGILQGIDIDSSINVSELKEFELWRLNHANLLRLNPLKEINDCISSALSDGNLTEEEIEDVLWLCRKYQGNYYDVATHGIQQLHGLMHGVLADGYVSPEEVKGLARWMDEYQALASYYPFDELNTLVAHILADGVVDRDEQEMLTTYLLQFVKLSDPEQQAALEASVSGTYSLTGLCALDPRIEFVGKQFCLTGKCSRGERDLFIERIQLLGGIYRNNVSRKTDYLVVGDDGNPCWSYACYGRKIEKAQELRCAGHPLVLVHEYDLWDALEDAWWAQ